MSHDSAVDVPGYSCPAKMFCMYKLEPQQPHTVNNNLPLNLAVTSKPDLFVAMKKGRVEFCNKEQNVPGNKKWSQLEGLLAGVLP